MLWICCSDGKFSLKLGSAINALWTHGIAFEIRSLLFPVKDVIGRKMNDGRALSGTRCRDRARTIAIERERLIRL